MIDYYELLGVPEDASHAEIRAAYRTLVARAHPDVNASYDAERHTSLLNEAWSVLRESATRAAYDAAGLATAAPLRCQRCGKITPELLFVVFSRARRSGPPRHDGLLACPVCRTREGREAAAASVFGGGFLTRRTRARTLAAIGRGLRGGKVDVPTSASLLRQIGFAFIREGRQADALAALGAVLRFGPDPAVARIVERLREVERAAPATDRPAFVPAAPPRSRIGWKGVFAGACLALVVAGCFFFIRRSMGEGSVAHAAVPPPAAASGAPAAGDGLAANVDASLRPDLERLASLVKPAPAASGGDAYLFDLQRDRAFARAYAAAVATLPNAARERNPWLVTLETTSVPSAAVSTPDTRGYVLASGCDPRACNAGFVSVAYDPAAHAVAAAAFYDGIWHEYGSRAAGDRAMLALGVARTHLPIEGRFELDDAERGALRQYVAGLRST